MAGRASCRAARIAGHAVILALSCTALAACAYAQPDLGHPLVSGAGPDPIEGKAVMTDERDIQEEAERLYAVLSDHYLPKLVAQSGFAEYSAASKDEVVARVARTHTPTPEGALIARLLFIRTPENEENLQTVFLANLHAPDAEARKFSLYGLKELHHPALADLAFTAMHDPSDPVMVAALNVLLPDVKKDPVRWAFLQNFYLAHRDGQEFHMSVAILQANGIEDGLAR